MDDLQETMLFNKADFSSPTSNHLLDTHYLEMVFHVHVLHAGFFFWLEFELVFCMLSHNIEFTCDWPVNVW